MHFRDLIKDWIPGVRFLAKRRARRRRIAELRRAIFLGRYKPDPHTIVEGLEKKHVLHDIKVDLPTE